MRRLLAVIEQRLANPLPRNNIELGKFVKNNHFRALEINQRQVSEAAILTKRDETSGKDSGSLWLSCLKQLLLLFF